ncbi:MAG TPA: ATP-grasp domain-containing protein [Candidatus Paceibacterota bacterium]|nr:ATP-grasp domain-containing protein [Candidatus Paceibacterota bacterium]
MARTIVGVLRGGTSGEYHLSLKTGAAILAALSEEKYEPRDILIDKSGTWHIRGIPMPPARILAQVDVVLNGLHGGIGEDGTVQRLLELHGARYAGSRPSSIVRAGNKARALETLRAAGILMPRSMSFNVENNGTTGDMARTVFSDFGPPYIVKPTSEGSSRGIRIARSIVELPDVLADVLDVYGSALVQEFLRGEDARVGVIEGFRGEPLYALPPAHMLKPEGKAFIDEETRQAGLVRHVVPSNFSVDEKYALIDAARRAHRALELSHFSRADFVLARGKPYLLEVSTLPGLYEGAAFPQMLEAVGSSVPEFLEHIIALARN